jgi:signal transduction histidine kinase
MAPNVPPSRSGRAGGEAASGDETSAARASGGARSVLLVEDNPGDAELLRELLAEPAAGLVAPTVVWVERVAQARALLARAAAGEVETPDAILLDLSLPDARGLSTVELVRAAAPMLPIVVLTGLDDEALAVQAVQAGAQDYLVKGVVTAPGLRRALRHALERQRLFDAARRATHARDMVLGIVAHDLRNPLSSIKMCAGALGGAATGAAAGTGAAPSPETLAELSGVIQRSAEWMEHIIRDLLDVTAIEAGRLAVEVALTEVDVVLARLRELFQPIAEERGVRFAPDLDAAATLPPVRADADRLLQALGNLVGNAVKFTSPGGLVTVTVATTHERGSAMVRFTVSDTGPGIAPEHLPHVFDRFWQATATRRAGAGLGLAIVKGIAEAHGGEVTVESAPGTGARFSLLIPEN